MISVPVFIIIKLIIIMYNSIIIKIVTVCAPVSNARSAYRCVRVRIRVASNPLSLPVYASCTRKGFEFECCLVGGAIEF